MSNIENYMNNICGIHSSGSITEHSYRPELSELISKFDRTVSVINEPKRIECGAPDLIVQLNDLTIGYLEQKDIGINICSLTGENLAQQKRYLEAMPNLIYTNCMDWNFYRDGDLVSSVKIGELISNRIHAMPENYSNLECQLRKYLQRRPQPISNPQDLALKMADKTTLVKDIIFNSLTVDKANNSELHAQYEIVKKMLIQNVSVEEFSDIYAETVAFGIFTARLHEKDTKEFNRRNVVELIPKSNPFLRGLFSIISGDGLGEATSWVIEDLSELFKVCDMAEIMKGFGSLVDQSDPFLHFYETFLNRYNPSKRNSKGVWYTPEPIVKFIVHALDNVLIREFGLRDGLADTSRVLSNMQERNEEVHRVQILDPATGTGTFLAEVIRQIASKVRLKTPSLWQKYVDEDLITRVHGFELLMAPYAICHVKLGMILKELGYASANNGNRFSVYLTNAIEKDENLVETLGFANWLSNEALDANRIKSDLPAMCVIGNPPYNAEDGVAKGWMGEHMENYKLEPGSNAKLKEANPKAINDLYVKFIRLGSHLIEKNGEGVLGFVTNHGYLENLVFRGMRWHLLKTFDKIWVFDLHGNTNRKEIGADGTPDQNVFDIRTGVAVIIAAKIKSSENELARIWHADIFGARETKYRILERESIYGDMFTEIKPKSPHYYFENIKLEKFGQYESGFSLDELFPENSIGIMTARDSFAVDMDYDKLKDRMEQFSEMDIEEARKKFELGRDTSEWQVKCAKEDIGKFDQDKIAKMCYRPFDDRWTYYTGHSRGVICRPRNSIMQNLIDKGNFALLSSRQQGTAGYQHVFVTDKIVNDCTVSNLSKEANQVFPLYICEEYLGHRERRINFNDRIFDELRNQALSKEFGEPDELSIFDYVYGVLHCPDYRKIFAEFIRKDFPRIPYPSSSESFWDVSNKGALLRKLHLMNEESIGEISCELSEGSNEIDRIKYEDEKLWLNSSQYFFKVTESAWDFKIGSYRPAEKWLKDRKGRILDYKNALHFCKILEILTESDRIMKTITLPNLKM